MTEQNSDDFEVLSSDASIDEAREAASTSLVLPDAVLPSTLQLIPVPGRPFFPAQIQPIVLNLKAWGTTLERASKTERPVLGLLYCGEQEPTHIDPDKVPSIGCAVRLHRAQHDGEHAQILVQGLKRFRIRRWITKEPPYMVEVDYPDNAGDSDSDEVRAYAMALINTIKELLPLNSNSTSCISVRMSRRCSPISRPRLPRQKPLICRMSSKRSRCCGAWKKYCCYCARKKNSRRCRARSARR
jgi:ATP-dependent Lon protease